MAPPPVAIRTSFQDSRPEAVPPLPKAEFPASSLPVTPLYPVLNMDGTYHVPPEAKPPVAMIAVEQEGEGDGLGETAMPENPYSPALPSNTQWSSGHRPPVVSRPSWAPRMPALDFSTPMGRELAMMSHRPDATFRTVDDATPSSAAVRERHEVETYYVSWSPAAATTLVTSLPDPEKQPMPFYRRMAQIQKTHSATWRDLKGLAEIKAGDSFWPIMKPAFIEDPCDSLQTFKSGEEFLQLLKHWARERLADQATTLQDLTQEKGETVERFAARMQQIFDDFGFVKTEKTHMQMLAQAFVGGLREAIKKALCVSRPEFRSLPMDTLVLVAKGIEVMSGRQKTGLMVATTGTADTDNPRPPRVCFNCGKPGHFRRACRSPRRQFSQGRAPQQQQLTPAPAGMLVELP